MCFSLHGTWIICLHKAFLIIWLYMFYLVHCRSSDCQILPHLFCADTVCCLLSFILIQLGLRGCACNCDLVYFKDLFHVLPPLLYQPHGASLTVSHHYCKQTTVICSALKPGCCSPEVLWGADLIFSTFVALIMNLP